MQNSKLNSHLNILNKLLINSFYVYNMKSEVHKLLSYHHE